MRLTQKSGLIRPPSAVLATAGTIFAMLASTAAIAQNSGSVIVDGNRAATKTYFETISCAAVFRIMSVHNESAMQAALSVTKRAGHSNDQKVRDTLEIEMSYLKRGDRTALPAKKNLNRC